MTTKVIKRAIMPSDRQKRGPRAVRAALPLPEEFSFNEPVSVDEATSRIAESRAKMPAIDNRIAALNAIIDRDRSDDDATEERILLGRKKSMLTQEIRALRVWLADHGEVSATSKGSALWPALRLCYRVLERISRGEPPDHGEVDEALDAIEYIVPQSYLDGR